MAAFLRTTALLTLVTLVVGACGGSDDSSSSKERSAASKSDAGYFDEEQSDDLNPLLADYDEASATYYEQAKPCERTANQLFEAGKTPRESVKCHLDRTQQYEDAVVALRTGIDDVEGDFREQCTEQVEAFSAFLTDFEEAIAAERADWNRYASGKATPQLQQHVNAVQTHATRFVEDEIPAMSKACYTEADRTAAGKA